jgi:transposase-like protein
MSDSPWLLWRPIAWKAGWSHGRQQEHSPIPAALPPELRERAVRMVLETMQQTGQRVGVITRIARQLGIGAEPLRGWVRQAEVHGGHRPGVTTAEHQRIAGRHASTAATGRQPRPRERARRTPAWRPRRQVRPTPRGSLQCHVSGDSAERHGQRRLRRSPSRWRRPGSGHSVGFRRGWREYHTALPRRRSRGGRCGRWHRSPARQPPPQAATPRWAGSRLLRKPPTRRNGDSQPP